MTGDWVTVLRDRGLLNIRAGFSIFTEANDQTDVKEFDVLTLGFVSRARPIPAPD